MNWYNIIAIISFSSLILLTIWVLYMMEELRHDRLEREQIINNISKTINQGYIDQLKFKHDLEVIEKHVNESI